MLIKITAERLLKRFDKFTVLRDIVFSVSTPGSIAVTGDNGSGKSTLLEIIAGIQKPTAGKMIYDIDGREVDLLKIQDNIGFSSPKINPYGDLTALENLHFAFKNTDNKDKKNYAEQLKGLLDKFNLYNDRNKKVKYFSSGMKQRLRLLFAIHNDPNVLILDEPGSNLDIQGKDMIYEYIESLKQKKIIIIATNQNEEARLCYDKINLKKRSIQEFPERLQSRV